MKRPIAILISGRGSNMQSLVRACQAADFPARVALVLSNNPDAAGLSWARDQGLEAVALERLTGETRADYDARLEQELQQRSIELVCLAGYMRLLSPDFTRRWDGKLLNIHPSLLPSFPGLDAQAQALRAGVRVTGCTVHFVDQGLDTGPIIDQGALHIEAGESLESMSARLLELEHQLYPKCLKQVAAQQVQLIDGKLIWR